jgi:signal transduction histidine kinase
MTLIKRANDSRKLYASFGAMLFLLLLLTGLSYSNFYRLAEADRQNIRTYQVLVGTAQLLNSLVNMETGLRGFMVTGDNRFLEPYFSGKSNFDRNWQQVRDLTAAGKTHDAVLLQLRAQKNRWVQSLSEPLMAQRRGAKNSAEAISLTARDALKRKNAMDAMRAGIAQIERSENEQLIQRTAQQERLQWRTLVTFVAGSFFSIFMTLVLAVLASRNYQRLALIVGELNRAKNRLEDEAQERTRAEERLAALNDDLRRSNAELEQFAYVASHDLQEPLRAVGGCVQILQRRYAGKLDDRADQFILHAVEGATRMQTLINDLLTYSRVGTRTQVYEPVAMEALLKRVLVQLRIALEETEALVTHDSLPTLWCDSGQIELVLQNFIANAIKFHGETPPRIHISARHDAERDEWTLSVEDHGIGIESEYFERIWVMFQRLHTRTEYSGTGIGLAICKKIVERHGGRIGVESVFGQGSTFWFALPSGPRQATEPKEEISGEIT